LEWASSSLLRSNAGASVGWDAGRWGRGMGCDAGKGTWNAMRAQVRGQRPDESCGRTSGR
jgi:hypothetical protein